MSTARRNPIARVLMGVLIFQLGLGALLFWVICKTDCACPVSGHVRQS